MARYITERASRPLQDDATLAPAAFGGWYARNGGDREDLEPDMRQLRVSGSGDTTLEEDLPLAQEGFDRAMRQMLGR